MHRSIGFYGFLLATMFGSYCLILIRFLVTRHSRKRWPIADAVIQKGPIATIYLWRNVSRLAVFLGYTYKVQGVRYAGYFGIYGIEEAAVQILRDRLPGASLQIRYCPSDPNVSFLVDYKDSRFDGLRAFQNPGWLKQAPTFDLQDTIRG
jgi:hypothetical protein